MNTLGQNMVISSGLLISTLGFGLMIMMNETSNGFIQYGIPLIAGVGIGMLFHSPYQVFTYALKEAELASGTSAFFLVRFTGATIGLACAGTVFFAKMSSDPGQVPGGSRSNHLNYEDLGHLDPATRAGVIHAISTAIQVLLPFLR
jgi:hypothetical protein